jgi:RHS repeat-associated protein
MNPNLIFLRKVVNQMSMFVAPAGPTASGIEDRAILRFSLNTNEVEFPVTNNLTVKEILERNGVGLITKEKDEKGLVTKYDFNEAKLIYYRCSTTTQNSNNGRYIGSTTSWSLPLLPIKETYGLGASYPLIYNYQYTPQLQLSKTIEPNAKELLFKYDAFGRLNKSQIGDGTNIYTIQETGYHNWSSIMGQSFDQNAANNYIETKTYNNFTGTDFNITRSYMDPMGRQYQKVYENYYGSEHLKTGEVYYDELNNPKTVNKSFVSSTSTPEYRSAQLSQRYYHQDDGNGNYVIQPFSQSYIPSSNVYEKNSNGRILGAAKAGRQISSTDKYVSSEYSIITLNQLNAELGTNYTSNVSITNSFAAIMAIPNNTLTNYLLTNAPLYLAAKALQGYGEASPSQKVRDDYIVSSIMTADKNKYYKTKIIDEDGNETRLYYTPDGNKIAERKSISNDNNAVTLFSYDARGNLIKIVNPEKQTSRFKYNFANWQYSSETPDGNVVTRIFNLSGQVMLEQDDNGRKGSDFKSSFMRGYDYDDMGRLVKQKKVSPRFQNFNPMSYLYVDPDAANPDAEINKVWDQCIDPRKAVTEIKAMFASVKINVAPLEFFVAAEFQCDVIPVSTSLAQPPTQLKWHPSNAMATRIPRMDIFFDDPWNDGGSDHSFLQPETPETIADGFLNESSYGWIYTCPYSLNMVCGEETLEKEWDYNNNRSENEVYKLNTKNYVSYIGPNAVTEIIDVQSLNTLNRLSRSISYDNKGNDIEQIIYSYDVFGNIIAESHFFNAYGLKTNAAHRATINYQYDLQGRILSEDVETEQYNNGQSYSFNLSSSYQYQYDRYGRLKTVGEDGNKKVTYKYDPISNKILERAYYRKVDQDNPITRHTYKYDLRDRLTDLCAKWTTDNLFYEELTYDDNIPTTLPIGSTWNSGNKNYNGNINGTVSNYAIRGMFAPGINAYWIGSPISKQYYYDKNSRLTYLDNNSPSVKNIYDGNVTSFGDESFTYDKAGSFTEQKYYTLDPVNSNAVLHTRSYKYKPGTGQAYEVSETGAAGYFVYTNKYDKTGNIRQDKSMNHSPVTDEYISYGRSNMPFSYYRHGNQKDLFLYNINDYRIYQHFYNEQDEYHIVDYQGRVVGIKKDLNSYTCGSENYTWIVNGNGKEVEYSPSKSINEQYRYFVKDHLGNIRISNSFNEQHPENLEYYTVSAYDYTAYGKILKSHVPQDKFLTTDNERDMKTGYDYRHHRFSDAETGRFLTVDPLANQFPSWSPYNYTEDNPVNKIDPLGLSANPIYGTDGAFLGTDDLGLQGQAIIMNRSDFTQGMRHTDAVSKNLGAAGLNGAGARSAFISHFRAQGNGGSVYGTAVPIALTAAAVDGPLPIGDIIGGVILAGATAYDATQRTFVTYTMRNAAGQTYVGRTSGYGDPYSIMMNRASGHHMKAFGYGSPVLDRAVQGYQGYPAIRGREQQLIDFYGGIGSPGVGNSIRGVSSYNPAYPIYHGASNLYFGPLAPYTGY